MFQKKHTSRAILTLLLAVILGTTATPLHTTHAQAISNIINQIVNTVAPSNAQQNRENSRVIITPAAVDTPARSIVPSVTITTSPTRSPSPTVSTSPRPSTSPLTIPSTSVTPRPATTTASTSASTSPIAATTGPVGTPDNTINGSATNYYVPLDKLSPLTTIALSLLAIIIGSFGAVSMLKVAPQKKTILTGGYSPRTTLQVQEPLLDQQ